MAGQLVCQQCYGKGATYTAAQEINDRFGNAETPQNIQAQGVISCSQCRGTGLQQGHYPG